MATMKINETLKARYRQQGYWGDATLADCWRLSAKAFADKQAVCDNHGTRYTYSELDRAAGTLAAWMVEQGIQPGDRVALQLPGWCEFTLIYLACLKSGAVVVPLLPAFRESELAWILNKCQARMLFTPTRFKNIRPIQMLPALRPLLPYLESVVAVEKLEPAGYGITLNQILTSSTPLVNDIATRSDDLAVLLFTSGTEGRPKGVMLTHNNLIASERAYCATLNLNATDVFLMPAPLAHATGFMHGVTAPFMIGAQSILMDIFVADRCLDLLEQEQCTCIMGATPFACDLLKVMQCRQHIPPSLRFFLCGGTTIPAKLIREYHKAGVPLLGVYGSTESAPHTIVRPYDSLMRQVNTDGSAVAGVEIKVVDKKRNNLPEGSEGEEASRGPNVFVGYFDEAELTAQALDDDGWYYSGDYCRLDKQGYIKITGRKKDIIVRGGENISSREVEDILLQHPDIADAAVVAMPDKRLGERSCAWVVLNHSAKNMTLSDVIAFFATKRIAKYKYPEYLVITDVLPRTASGKVKKFLLRKDIIKRLTLAECESSNLILDKVGSE
ncbi:medium-chain fatty-acid--CoA ligase [Phytobacter sp. V91]|uniref:medium-chain fatty-acid--CoA ligase n=1 Tax=Phytobacter sp. V91 TaxID=3369425 RepID=UPI003F619266